MLEISRIKEGGQARESINEATVKEYCDHLESGGTFPPIVVFFDSADYWLADGWHRFLAHKRLGMLSIQEDVKLGDKRDAMKYALGANYSHGLPRTNADKRKAVTIALADEEWSKLPSREIAGMCKVSHNLVAEMKSGLSSDDSTKKRKFLSTVDKAHDKPLNNNDAPKAEKQEFQNLEIKSPSFEAEKQEVPDENEYTELDEKNDQIAALQDIVAIGYMDATPEDKQYSADLISDLRSRVKTLEAALASTEIQRDAYIRENGELKKQCAMQRTQIKKLGAK
jgi:hypothetical protein